MKTVIMDIMKRSFTELSKEIKRLDLCQVFRHIFLRIFINFFKLRLRSCYKY